MENIYKEIIEGALEAILFVDREGIIRLWNHGAEKIFGYQKKEAVGRSLDLIIPEKLRQRHWDGYFHVMETGNTRYGNELLSVPAVRKDGNRISLEFSVTLIRDEEEGVIGVAAIIRDVTAKLKDK